MLGSCKPTNVARFQEIGKNNSANNSIGSSRSKKVIVLFHGLNRTGASEIAIIGQYLSQDIKDSEIIILTRKNSCTVRMEDQVTDTYEQLEKVLAEKALLNSPIVLIGDSQGGVLAIKLYDTYKQSLNIVGIITNHAPLEGTSAVNIPEQAIDKLDNILQTLLPWLSESLKLNISNISFKKIFFKYFCGQGLIELSLDSSFITNIKEILTNIQIPVLALGGTIEPLPGLIKLINFFSGLTISSESVETFIQLHVHNLPMSAIIITEFNEEYAKIVGDKENDSLLPLYSQIGKNIRTNPTFFETFVVPGYHHFHGAREQPEVYNKITAFINKCFSAKK
ncbi:MAG: hypothetical protein BGO68_00450 [Candidatus Amoebophilus sp. 36-38]|nr:MAG: hypothetical protein BGO68_00450 [Candidatus Amoebophilus sp. 36-38]